LKIHALCLVKNERDIIAQTLRSASAWCDYIYVLDNGSEDGTWELVQALSRELKAVRPFKRDPKPFFDNIRDEILLAHLSLASPDDWWCILDADEFYIDDPRQFLAAVPRTDRAVWPVVYNYLFTEKDYEGFRNSPESYADDTPVEQRLRYYMVTDYAELRFFRHSPQLKGVPVGGYYPVHHRRIRFKQYSYRSPQQISLRLETRREPMLRGDFIHEKRSNWVAGGTAEPGPAAEADLPASWQERIASAQECEFDALDGVYAEPPPWKPPGGPALSIREAVRVSARRLVAGGFRRARNRAGRLWPFSGARA